MVPEDWVGEDMEEGGGDRPTGGCGSALDSSGMTERVNLRGGGVRGGG